MKANTRENPAGHRYSALRVGLVALLSTINLQVLTFAQGTAFTYQGRLNTGGSPANGTYDFRFRVAADSFANNYVGSSFLTNGIAINNGLFTATLDFGLGIFAGSNYWLEVDVRTNGAGSYTALSPLQALTPTPYAIFANTASNVTGAVAGGALSGAYSGAVTFNNAADQFTGAFTGNGANVTNVNAATLGGLGANQFWKTTGNSNTAAGSNFLGTVDSQPLELRANGLRVLRLEPATNASIGYSPNVIGGYQGNTVATGVIGATISGGGRFDISEGDALAHHVTAHHGTIGGGDRNTVSGQDGTIAGGGGNIENGPYSFIGGGLGNKVYTNSHYATIAGGAFNSIGTNSSSTTISGGYAQAILSDTTDSTIGGGSFDLIGTNSFGSTIGGGGNNSVNDNARSSTIAGGYYNTIQQNAPYSFVGGGQFNTSGSNYSTIGGGLQNTNIGYGSIIGGGQQNFISNSIFATVAGGTSNSIVSTGDYATITGGWDNTIFSNAQGAVIGGGYFNYVQTNANSATVGGGYSNVAGGIASTVPGGYQNSALGNYSFAAGQEATASHDGAFVWSDSTGTPFSSTASNQFSVRASGGVRFETGGAGIAVDGQTLGNGLGNYVFAFNSGSQSVATANAYQDINFSTDQQIAGWTHAAGTPQYTNVQTGLYLIQYYGQFITAVSGGTNAQMRATLNLGEIPGSHAFVAVPSLGQAFPVSKTFLVSANASDVLTLQFTGTGTGIRLSSTANSTLTITRIQ